MAPRAPRASLVGANTVWLPVESALTSGWLEGLARRLARVVRPAAWSAVFRPAAKPVPLVAEVALVALAGVAGTGAGIVAVERG